jgi:Calx-beta domain
MMYRRSTRFSFIAILTFFFGAVVGNAALATSTNGTLAFSASSYVVDQSTATITITVKRASGSSGAASVRYKTTHETALTDWDFGNTWGTLRWAAGDMSDKTFSVPILQRTELTANRSFLLTLYEPTTAALGSPATATVTIDANEAGGTLKLAASTYTVPDSADSATVTVNRTGGSSGAVSVAYATASGTAVAGQQFVPKSGTLKWGDGDMTAQAVSVAINNATPVSGNRSFTVALSNPNGGAALSTPSSANVTITGSSAGSSGGPSAVTNLQLIDQGGPNKSQNAGGAALSNYQQISWSAATPGSNPIASYNIYRNGVLYANTTALTYADTAATNSNSPTFVQPSTIYRYNVAAVDNEGNVGPQAAQMSVYAYQNGHSNWSKDDLSYDGATPNYASTAGSPQGGAYDVSVYFPQGGFLPVVAAPQAPGWDLEIGAFNYFTIDINPGPVVSSYVQLILVSRLPPGDDAAWANGINVFAYGPKPVANTWATYKVPLSVLHFGTSTFTGSISGTTLKVTAVSSSGMGAVDADGFLTGPGIPAGTYIVGYHQAASIGTFTIAGPGINSSTSVPSEQMTFHRTGLYKFGLQPNTNPVTMYFNNMGFTVN